MATRRRTTANTTYSTYGSVAYAPAYDGSAVRVPRHEEELQQPLPQRQQRERVRRRALTRTRVQVREAGQVAPFAVVGFLAVAVFAALLLLSYTQYTVVNQEVVSLRNQLSALESEHATLAAQYEKVFDITTIEETIGSEMVKPTGDQVVYIDLSEPDAVTVFGATEGENPLLGVLDEISGAVSGLIEYFR